VGNKDALREKRSCLVRGRRNPFWEFNDAEDTQPVPKETIDALNALVRLIDGE
jgi:hypothetical protein